MNKVIENRNTNFDIEITNIYDNLISDKSFSLIDSWGFGCIIRDRDKTILFDVGRHSEVLLLNMERMNIDPGEIDIVVISHSDDDHSDGLLGFLKQNPDIILYLVDTFPTSLYKKLDTLNINYQFVKSLSQISSSVYSTGALVSNRSGGAHIINGIPKQEQSLIITTPQGLLVLTGCAHADILLLANFVNEHFNEYPVLIAGGFHYKDETRETILGILSDELLGKIKYLAPTHCSGEIIKKILKEGNHNKYIELGLGARFNSSVL